MKELKKDKVKVKHVTPKKNRKLILISMWVLVGGSVLFGVFNNMRSERQIVTEKTEVVREMDSNYLGMNSFVTNFAKVYYSWDTTNESKEKRKESLKSFMREDLLNLNGDNLREVKEKSSVSNVQIYSVTPIEGEKNQYTVFYTVEQVVNSVTAVNAYTVDLYNDGVSFVITKNPTFVATPKTSSFVKKHDKTSDVIEDSKALQSFLETFFKIYPTATQKELVYYTTDKSVKAINKKYTLISVNNVVVKKVKDSYHVHFYVTYTDEFSKMQVINEYNAVIVKKEGNFVIEELK